MSWSYKEKTYPIVCHIMKIQIYAFALAALAGAQAMVYLGIDPIKKIFGGLIDFEMLHLKIIFLLLRFAIFLIFSLELAKAPSAFFIVGLIVVFSINSLLKNLQRFEDHRKNNSQSFAKITKVYREYEIWLKYTNQHFCSFSVPLLIIFGELLLLMCNFLTIRFYSKLYITHYLIFPITSGGAMIFNLVLLPQGAAVFELSNNYLRRLRGNVKSKFEKKTAGAIKPVFIQVLSFGVVRNSLKTTLMQNVVESTINLLMTF